MSSVVGTALDKFQDIVEPFKAVSSYSSYVYLGVLLIAVILFYAIDRYRANFLWRRLKKIERGCIQGFSPRASIQRIYLVLQEYITIPDELSHKIERLCYGLTAPTLKELSLFLVTLKPMLLTLKKCEVVSTIDKPAND